MGRMIRKKGTTTDVAQAAASLNDLRGKVGFFEASKYADGTPVAYVASIQEFGASAQNIPPRPFMRPAVAANSDKWAKAFGKGATAVMKGRFTAAHVMASVCEDAAGEVRKSIAAVNTPPLADSTVAARRRGYADKKTTGSLTKPLVATGLMVASVSYEVTAK